MESEDNGGRVIDPGALGNRERYHLVTSLVVPRPIGWVSTRSSDGVPNLAPFSYFNAVSATPMLLGVSIGHRRSVPKDTLMNIRASGSFCLNVVTEEQLESMNLSSGEHPPEIDEFEVAGLPIGESERVRAPYVASCPAVFECRLDQEVELKGGNASLVIGEVVGIRLSNRLVMEDGTWKVTPESLRPVGRLGGDLYSLTRELITLPRPQLT
jgi:flavin reductase (DIM6/NTAB) family NADH-FMN oxidoreductase RutF